MPISEAPVRPPLVLIANDQEWSARSLESIMGPQGYAVLRAYNGRQALELARSVLPDAVIVDAHMPDLDGIDVCLQLRADPRFGDATPLIITTSGPVGRAERMAAYAAGAWEFCSQPLDGELLLLKLDTFMRAKRETERARRESLVDEATGLYSMRGLTRRAREIGAEAFRQHQPLACVALSAETDQSGLATNELDEAVLRIAQHVGGMAKRTGRGSDAVGRMGQAEFGIIAPATEAAGAVRLVERLQQSLHGTSVDIGGGRTRTALTLRAGYFAVPDYAESPVDAVEMLVRAATALRQLRAEDTLVGVRGFDERPSTPFVS